MQIIHKSSDIDDLVSTVKDTGDVYFVTAFSGLLAPYWDSEAGGLLIGISAYTNRAHICRATLEAVSFQVRPSASLFIARVLTTRSPPVAQQDAGDPRGYACRLRYPVA